MRGQSRFILVCQDEFAAFRVMDKSILKPHYPATPMKACDSPVAPTRCLLFRALFPIVGILTGIAHSTVAQQPQRRTVSPPRQGVTAPSHVYRKGDVEILTFEMEQDYDRLQELYRTTQDTQPVPGETTTLFLRSRTDHSVQPYAVRLPKDYSSDRKYPLMNQLHGLNFNEVLSPTKFL